MSEKSRAIASFIASSLPVYTHVQLEGKTCALSLVDGTIVAPIIDPNLDPAKDYGWPSYAVSLRIETTLHAAGIALFILATYGTAWQDVGLELPAQVGVVLF